MPFCSSPFYSFSTFLPHPDACRPGQIRMDLSSLHPFNALVDKSTNVFYTFLKSSDGFICADGSLLPDRRTSIMTRPIGRLISILHRRAQSHYTRALKEFGISSAEYPVLFLLQRREGLTQDEIAADLSIDKSAVTRIIQSLCEKQLITRRQDDADRR